MDYKKLWIALMKTVEETSISSWTRLELLDEMKDAEIKQAREEEKNE